MTTPTQAQTIRINGQLHRVMRSMMDEEYYVPIPRENNMTKPTKAQIGAAIGAYGTILSALYAKGKAPTPDDLRAMMNAAITAAAEVGKMTPDEAWEYHKETIPTKRAAAAEVGRAGVSKEQLWNSINAAKELASAIDDDELRIAIMKALDP